MWIDFDNLLGTINQTQFDCCRGASEPNANSSDVSCFVSHAADAVIDALITAVDACRAQQMWVLSCYMSLTLVYNNSASDVNDHDPGNDV